MNEYECVLVISPRLPFPFYPFHVLMFLPTPTFFRHSATSCPHAQFARLAVNCHHFGLTTRFPFPPPRAVVDLLVSWKMLHIFFAWFSFANQAEKLQLFMLHSRLNHMPCTIYTNLFAVYTTWYILLPAPINLTRRCVACGMSNALRVHLVLGPSSFVLRSPFITYAFVLGCIK